MDFLSKFSLFVVRETPIWCRQCEIKIDCMRLSVVAFLYCHQVQEVSFSMKCARRELFIVVLSFILFNNDIFKIFATFISRK